MQCPITGLPNRSMRRSPDFDRPGRRLLDAPRRDAGINRTRLEDRVLGHDAQGADLTALAGIDADADHAAEADRHTGAEPDAARLDDSALDRMPGQMHAL